MNRAMDPESIVFGLAKLYLELLAFIFLFWLVISVILLCAWLIDFIIKNYWISSKIVLSLAPKL